MTDSQFSTQAALINIAQVLEQLETNSKEFISLKQLILTEFDCKNEQTFLCRVIRLLHKNLALSNNSLTKINDKCYEIYEQLQLETKLVGNDSNNNCNDSSYISLLDSNTIDEIGSYLEKTDSVNFGLTNRLLYVE